MTQSRTKDLNVTWWETFVVITDEITSRFFQCFKRNDVKFMKISGVGNNYLNAKEFCMLIYNMLSSLSFGKPLVRNNILEFADESMRRLSSKMIRQQNQIALQKNNCLLEHSIELFRKMFAEDEVENLSKVDDKTSLFDRFELNISIVSAYLKRAASDINASSQLAALLFENDKDYSSCYCNENFQYVRRDDGFLVLGNGRCVDVNGNISSLTHVSNFDLPVNNSITTIHLRRSNHATPVSLDTTASSSSDSSMTSLMVNKASFTQEDAHNLLTIMTLLNHEFFQNTDFKGIYYTWAALFAFFRHIQQIEEQHSTRPRTNYFYRLIIICSVAIILAFT